MTNLIKSLLILFVFGMAFSFTSCKKCTTCTYNYQYEDSQGETVTFDYEYDEYCGKKSEVEDFENACVKAADDAIALQKSFGFDVSGGCTCN